MAKFIRRRHGRRKRLRLKRRNGRRGRKSNFDKRVLRAVHKDADHKYDQAYQYGESAPANDPTPFFTSITQGTTDKQRVGSDVDLRSLKLRLNIYGNSSWTGPTTCRLIIGCWLDYPASGPVREILEDHTNPSASWYDRDYLTRRKWIPMYDRTWTMAKIATTQPVNNGIFHKELNFYGKRLPKKRIRFTSTNVPDHVYFFYFCTNDVLEGVNYQVASRYTWTDV